MSYEPTRRGFSHSGSPRRLSTLPVLKAAIPLIVKGFGRPSAYESLRGPNPRAARDALGGFRVVTDAGASSQAAEMRPGEEDGGWHQG